MEMSFALVMFDETDVMAVIPIGWLKGNYCMWPNCKSRDLTIYIDLETKPGKDWSKYKVKILGIYGSYEEARKHEKKAEAASSKVINAKKLIREHKLLKKIKKEREKRKIDLLDLSSSSSSSDEEGPPPSKQLAISDVTSLAVPANDYVVENIETDNVQINAMDDDSELPNIAQLGKEISQIKTTLKEHGETLISILNALNTLVGQRSIISPCKEMDFPISLPMKTFDDLESMEINLANSEKLQKNLCSLLAQIGGINLGNCIRRMMTKLMSNDLAMCFSWLGVKGKRPFVNLQLRKIIFDAIRSNKQFKNVLDSDIETVVRDWLRHAKARTGYDIMKTKVKI